MRGALPWTGAATGLVLAASGCDLAFGLERGRSPDGAVAPDAELPIDAPPACTTSSSTVAVVADTTLIHDDGGDCDASLRFGTFINANVGQTGGLGTRSRVLVRFALTAPMVAALQPGGGFASGSLLLLLKPEACTGPCASAPIELTVYPIRNQWDEGTGAVRNGAGWCMRKQAGGAGTMWEAAGAEGTSDRGPAFGTLVMSDDDAAADSLAIPLGVSPGSADGVASWIEGNQLSLLLAGSGPAGILYTKAREGGSGGAQLTITSCK